MKGNLKVHLRVHTNDRPYHCPFSNICDKSFKTKSQLSDHLLKHTQIKKYKCPDCQTLFSRKSRLKIHMLIHKNIIPFQCNICKKKFREKSNFNYHMKKHIPQFKKFCKKISTVNAFNTTTKLNNNENVFVLDKKVNELSANESDNSTKLEDFNYSPINNINSKNNNDNYPEENNFMNNKIVNNQKILFKCKCTNDLFNGMDDDQINYINNLNNPFNNINIDLNYHDDNSNLNCGKDLYINQNDNCLNNNFDFEKDKKEIDLFNNILTNNNNDIDNDLFNNHIQLKDNDNNNILFNETKKFTDYYYLGNNNDNNYFPNNNDDIYLNNTINFNNFELIVKDSCLDSKIKNKIYDGYYSNELAKSFL